MRRFRALVELTRAPAALTVLGDSVTGAVSAGRRLRGRRAVLPAASAAAYWAGMVLNDWADREVDAAERPERPIPSGRIEPVLALGLAAGLGGAGLLIGAAAGRSRQATALLVSVIGYDVVFKPNPAGPVSMAACRALDVLLGGGRDSWPAAARVAAHTWAVTSLSRGEVHGASPRTAATAAAVTGLITASLPLGCASPAHRAAVVSLGTAYAGAVGGPQWRARADPRAARVREATRRGVHGTVLLQAALSARRNLPAAAALVAVLPAIELLGRKVSPT
ncbi:SCO3242 family prenyltransferase [Saccharopolyspora griseoalba]|uniref:SCO3242 family prenyltransferase n=1 Tax=Saccharopolyspora griseoalba TaxID=1431848 RepID=A0ABW2LFQ4_9PSEU